MDDSTVVYVSKEYAKHGSYRKTASALGVPYTLIRDIIKRKHDHVSTDTENALRRTLGLPMVLPMVPVSACPDCGSVHHGRCHGRQVALRPVSQRTYTTIHAMPAPLLAAAIRHREAV